MANFESDSASSACQAEDASQSWNSSAQTSWQDMHILINADLRQTPGGTQDNTFVIPPISGYDSGRTELAAEYPQIIFGGELKLPKHANDNNPPPKPANAGQMTVPVPLAA